ncbi:hypothetical protein EHO58_07740 [Leptospira selangorensis]|uniref:hypothetical protein n=1 Tax=Leptospira selangorensis TaxID=2484982 RepID=UPI00108442B6|nr:hypothetical protein [Leptospira selangorensis]TGK08477.1 hypothetical protein EHO58_07740 [Leptospira selangorensis]
MKRHFFSTILLFLFTFPIWSQAANLWQTIVGGEQFSGMVAKDCPEDLPGYFVPLKDGSSVLVGSANDCGRVDTNALAAQKKYSNAWAAKIDGNGSPVWWRYLFTSKPVELGGYTQSVLTYESVFAKLSSETSDGGFVTIGTIGSVEKKQLIFMKYDSDGKLVWERFILPKEFCDSFCGETDVGVYHLHELSNGKWTAIVSVQSRVEKETKEGNKTTVTSTIETAYLFVRFSKDGDLKSVKHLKDIKNFPQASLGFSDGGVLLAENTNVQSGKESQKDVILHRIDEDGKPVWKKQFGKPGIEEWASRIIPLSDGNLLFAGAVASSPRNNQAWLMKLSQSGDLLWETVHKTEGLGFLTDIIETPEKEFMSISADGEGPLRLVKFSADGKKLWEKKNTKRLYLAYRIINAPDGFIIAAYTKGKPAIYTDAILIRTDKEGNLSKDAVRKNFPN